MPVLALPSSPAALAKARWEDLVPYFDDLAERPLDESTIEGWLQTWSTLEELVTEAAAVAMIAYTIDTSDPEKEADHLRFSTEVLPKMEERSVELARRLVESGYRTPALETTLARFRTSIEIFREANVPIFSELEELSARYQRITGSMTVEWEGQERPLPQLQPYLKSPDRTVRERAFRAAAGALHRAAGESRLTVRPDVRAAPAGGAERRLRQLQGLHLSRQVPVRLHPVGLRAFPRGGGSHGGAGGGADARGAAAAALAGPAPALGHGRGSVPQRAAAALRRRPTSSSAGLAGSSSGSIPRSAASSRS